MPSACGVCNPDREGDEPFANGEDIDAAVLWSATVSVTESMRRVSPYHMDIASRHLVVVSKTALEGRPAESLPDINELRTDTPTFVYLIWLTASGWNRPWSGDAWQTHVEYTWGGGRSNPARNDPAAAALAATEAMAQVRFFSFRLGACTTFPGHLEGESIVRYYAGLARLTGRHTNIVRFRGDGRGVADGTTPAEGDQLPASCQRSASAGPTCQSAGERAGAAMRS
jgi:hypothetical protein